MHSCFIKLRTDSRRFSRGSITQNEPQGIPDGYFQTMDISRIRKMIPGIRFAASQLFPRCLLSGFWYMLNSPQFCCKIPSVFKIKFLAIFLFISNCSGECPMLKLKKLRLIVILIWAVIIAGSYGIAQTIIDGGPVSGTWTTIGSPYLVQGDITVEAGQMLTIEPGVEVKFSGNTGLFVSRTGSLLAEGTPESMIVFTSDQLSPSPGDWTGLTFSRTYFGVSLQYCRVEYATIGIKCTSWDCACVAYDNFAVIKNSEIRYNSEDGIQCLAEGCTGWICIPNPLGEVSPQIHENWIYSNSGHGISLDVRYNDGDARPEIIRNVIEGNNFSGIKCDTTVNPTIINNTIINNSESGISGYLGDQDLQIVNNIVAWNGIGIEALAGSVPLDARNNDVWGNGTDYQGLTPPARDISSDPLFVDALEQDYTLEESSPCIDTGDPRFPRDPDLTLVDMGAFYFHQSGIIAPVASFYAEPPSGVFPLTVSFNDNSSGMVSEWAWEFGDGQVAPHANSYHPSHTFETPGNYTISLTVGGPAGESSHQKEDYIQVLPRVASATDIVYPQIALGGGYECIFMAGNRTDAEWSGRIELRRGHEEPWSTPWTVDGQPRSGFSIDLTLAPRTTRKFVFTSDEPLQAGYLRVMSEQVSAKDSLATSLFYNYRPSGSLADSTATPQSQQGKQFWFPAEKTDLANTGFAYCSANRQSGFSITITLFDTDGNEVAQETLTYEGHTARFFAGPDGIFSEVPDGFLGSIWIESQEDLYLAVLGFTATSGNSFQLTSLPPRRLPVVDDGSSPPDILYPQVALGGGYECMFLTGNHTDSFWSGTVELLQGNAEPWSTSWSLDAIVQAGNTIDITLAPRATRKYVLTSDEPLQAGYLRVSGAKASAGDALVTAFSYNYRPVAPLVDSTATPRSQQGNTYWFSVEKSQVFNTGLAYCSALWQSGFPVTLTLFDESGAEFGQETMTFAGHTARFFAGQDGIFSNVPDGFVGAVRVDSQEDLLLAVLGLTSTSGETFQLTSLSPRLNPPPVTGLIQTLSIPGSNLRGLTHDGAHLWFLDGGYGFGASISQVDSAGNILDTIDTPAINPQGLTYDGSSLWSADSFGFSSKIYRFDLSQTGGDSIDLTYRYYPWPRGLTYDGSAFWVADSIEDKIFQIDATGTVLGSINSPGEWPSGLTFDGTYFWNADETDQKIYKLDMQGNVLDSFNSPGISPQGLAFDGTYLWHVDYHNDEIYKFDTAGNLLESFDSPTFAHFGMASDGTFLYVINFSSEIYKLDMDGNVVETFNSPAQQPRGLTFDGNSLWVVDDNQDKIYEVNPSGTGVSHIEAPGWGPEGLAFDGTHLWISDGMDQMIYKLDTSGTVLHSFPSPGPEPQDLAFDGTYLWNVDTHTEKIYMLDMDGTILDFFDCPEIDWIYPQGLASDGEFIWTADSLSNKIYKLDLRRNSP